MSDELIKLTFDVEPTGVPLTVSILLNNTVVWKQLVDKIYNVEIFCDDSLSKNVLELCLEDKQPSHTEIGVNGEIIKDSTVKFSNFIIDEVEISGLITKLSKYHHNFNGNGPDATDVFYSEMGCNGTVVFEFGSPFYLWLLENM